MVKSVYEQIKKQNGEMFAQAIRKFDSGIFDVPSIVSILKYAGRDAQPLLFFLESLKNIQIELNSTKETPFELLKKAGYDAFYADTLEKQNSIEPYFAPRERLCTFLDETRFKKYHIIHAIKEGALTLERSQFKQPYRDDPYATSVISIQILKTGGFISIKNRYNHSVLNPDNTFDSDPDNIIKGLSCALRVYFGVDFSTQKVVLPKNFLLYKNQLIRYHKESNNFYFGDGFYFKDGVVHEVQKDYQLVVDNFIIDLKERKVLNPAQVFHTSFLDAIASEIKGKKLELRREGEFRSLFADGEKILSVSREGQIDYVCLPNAREIETNFLSRVSVRKVVLPNLVRLGDSCMSNCDVEEFEAPQLKSMGHYCFRYTKLKAFRAHLLVKMGMGCLCKNDFIEVIDLRSLNKMGAECLSYNPCLKFLNIESVEKLSYHSVCHNYALIGFNGQNLAVLEGYNLCANSSLGVLSLSNLECVGTSCICGNKSLRFLKADKLMHLGYSSINGNDCLEELRLGCLVSIGRESVSDNKRLKRFYAPKLLKLEPGCCVGNIDLEMAFFDLLNEAYDCMGNNPNLRIFYAPNLVDFNGVLQGNAHADKLLRHRFLLLENKWLNQNYFSRQRD